MESLFYYVKGVKTISAQSEGKRFENAFVKSIPDYVFVKRLNDNASAWAGGDNTRFASNNECDYILFNDKTRTLYGIELKTTDKNSLTYWREDFEDKTKKQTFQIRKCQVLGLKKWSKHLGVFGFIINFRKNRNRTFFIMIDDFLDYTSTLSKKSINMDDVLNMNPIEIESNIVRTNYKYNVEKFLTESRL